MNKSFSSRVLTWFDQYGRKDLPWQRDRSPYGVWVAEIMLQQTRVETVVPYYEKFMRRFASIEQLAYAPLDEVLHHWTGLGYYARARNLHRAARQLCEKHHGIFPQTFDEAIALPGIGRSTAAAILALSFNQPHAILDGNVKRVLSRYFAVTGWPGRRSVEIRLWKYAESLLPENDVAQYTQAMMDIGATLCTRTNPNCAICPINFECMAYNQRRQCEFPTPKPTRNLPQRKVLVALVQNRDGAVWLEKRPPVGIWGGLYSFPEFADESSMQKWLKKTYKEDHSKIMALSVVTHTFSHFQLRMYPKLIQLDSSPNVVMEDPPGVWYKGYNQKIGLAAPIEKTLRLIMQNTKEGSHDAHGAMCEAR